MGKTKEELTAEFYERITNYGFTHQEYVESNSGTNIELWRICEIFAELSAGATAESPIQRSPSKVTKEKEIG